MRRVSFLAASVLLSLVVVACKTPNHPSCFPIRTSWVDNSLEGLMIWFPEGGQEELERIELRNAASQVRNGDFGFVGLELDSDRITTNNIQTLNEIQSFLLRKRIPYRVWLAPPPSKTGGLAEIRYFDALREMSVIQIAGPTGILQSRSASLEPVETTLEQVLASLKEDLRVGGCSKLIIVEPDALSAGGLLRLYSILQVMDTSIGAAHYQVWVGDVGEVLKQFR